MPSIGTAIQEAAVSDPRQVRLIFSYFKDGRCVVEVQECYNIGSMTFEINGEATEVICTNIRTGENEVVGIIDTGSTKRVTFDISRLLPQTEVSRFMRLVRENCGLRMFIARASSCIDPFNPNDFEVLDVLGEVRLGTYNRTEMLFRDKANAAEIEESTTVTAYDWWEAGQQVIATRGGLNTAPIVDITVCDKKSCGGRCADDSDGCQRWFWVQSDGIVGYTSSKFTSEAVLAEAPTGLGFTGPALSITCAPRDILIVTDSAGVMYTTSQTDILNGVTPTWSTLSIDINGDPLVNLVQGEPDFDTATVWFIGVGGNVYQYNASLGTMTPITTVPGVVADLTDLDVNGDLILIGGVDATLLRSEDGGTSFSLLTITDPATDLPLAATVDINAVEALSDTNYAVGTSDDRVLFTVDSGLTWISQVIAGQGAGVITDLEFDPIFHQIGWLTRNEGGVGSIYKTYYGNCEEWLEVPESQELLPDNDGLAKIVPCLYDINTVVAAGTSGAGAGVIFVGTTTEK